MSKTWEVKLDTQGNGVITVNIPADDWTVKYGGMVLYTEASGEINEIAYYPLTKLVGLKLVTL